MPTSSPWKFTTASEAAAFSAAMQLSPIDYTSGSPYATLGIPPGYSDPFLRWGGRAHVAERLRITYQRAYRRHFAPGRRAFRMRWVAAAYMGAWGGTLGNILGEAWFPSLSESHLASRILIAAGLGYTGWEMQHWGPGWSIAGAAIAGIGVGIAFGGYEKMAAVLKKYKGRLSLAWDIAGYLPGLGHSVRGHLFDFFNWWTQPLPGADFTDTAVQLSIYGK
jgi:hypothetical protein